MLGIILPNPVVWVAPTITPPPELNDERSFWGLALAAKYAEAGEEVSELSLYRDILVGDPQNIQARVRAGLIYLQRKNARAAGRLVDSVQVPDGPLRNGLRL
jgi:hypothetical protein